VKSIKGREILNITLDSISFAVTVSTFTHAAITPIRTTTARMNICDIIILVSIAEDFF